MTKRIDVVQVLLSPRIGGAESLAATLQQQWLSQGLDARTVYLDPPTGTRSPVQRVQHLRSQMRELRPRAVLAHSALPNVYARLVAPLDVSICTVMHGGDDFADPKLRRAERVLRWRTTAVVTVNEEQRAQYRARFGTQVAVERIPNAISASMRPSDDGADRAFPTTAITVARVVPQKDPEFWAAVAGAARSTLPDLRFEWWGPVGDDPEAQRTVAAVAGLDNAQLRGSTDQPAAVYQEADLLFHPSRAEAQSIGLLEAAACALPIVCSDTVGATLDARVPRVEFSVGDVADAVRALEQAVADHGAARARARDVADVVRAEYSAAACADRYAALLGLDASTGLS